MPMIAYVCSCKHLIKKFIRRAADAASSIPCSKCENSMKKTLSIPNSISKIVIDNGSQARQTEIVPNIVELMEERSNKDYRED